MKKILKYQETNKIVKTIELVTIIIALVATLVSFVYCVNKNSNEVNAYFSETVMMSRDKDSEDYNEDNKMCAVRYTNGQQQMIVVYSYQDYLQLDQDEILAYRFETDDEVSLYFDHPDVTLDEIIYQYKQYLADELAEYYGFAICCLIMTVAVGIIYFFGKCFSGYEKIWFVSIMILASIFSIIFPESSSNGVNGIVIMLLYLLDTFLNILCELLISKQSRYNFLVSIAVEITEILISIVLMYRFATMAVTLFFWLPIDIISFISWSKHKDKQEQHLTVVRKLKGYQEILIVIAIVVWTIIVGYIISDLDIKTDFILNKSLETIVIYLDACASAVGIANGLFIYFRLQEQWIAWYVCALLETIINVLTGQYVLLVLKLGYFTNTTYGYIKWNRYISSHQSDNS